MAAGSSARRKSSATYGMAIGVLLLVAALIVAVLYVGRLRYRAKSETRAPEPTADAASAEAAADPFAAAGAEEDSDPFEELDRSAPAETSAGAVDPFASLDRDDPFADVPEENQSTLVPEPGALTGSEVWQEALAIVDRVGGRLMLATEAREKSRPDEERKYRREAIASLDDALRKTERWAEEEVARYAPHDLQVRTVTRMRKAWRAQAEELRRQNAP
jgi:hypothetical protein